MPSDTDRSLPPASAPSGLEPRAGWGTAADGSGTAAGGAAAGSRSGPVWPITALLVLLGWCLLAWTVFVAAINTAPFFGETASRDRYLESGMVALTGLVPVALLLVLGILAGSRWGLALLALPALLLVPLGVGSLGETGDPQQSGYGRAARWDDAFADATRLNWAVGVVLLLVIAAVVWRRRRQTGIRANP